MITDKQVEAACRAYADGLNGDCFSGTQDQFPLLMRAALEAYEVQKMRDEEESRPFMCWVEHDCGEDPVSTCVLDEGNRDGCNYASGLTCREQCKYWAQEPPKEG